MTNNAIQVFNNKDFGVNESVLYSLILASKLPDARKFKLWITSERSGDAERK